MIFFLTAVTLVYLALWVWLRNGLSTLASRNDRSSSEFQPSVSIVVAARNEENNIGTLLQDTVSLDYPKDRIEVIVVNDQSSDRTGEVVESFSGTHPFVQHVIPEPPPPGWSPKKWALAAGVARSKGEIMLFTDADCSLPKEWISAMVYPFNNPEVGMVAGPSPLTKSGGLWEHTLLADSLGQDALAAAGISRGIPLTASGRNLAIRRKTFEGLSGYAGIEAYFSGDDDLMMHKVHSSGWDLTFRLAATAEITSPPSPGLLSFAKQRLRFASKGKTYFQLPFVGGQFKSVLGVIFLANLCVLGGQVVFLSTLQSVWLLPWFIKILGDGLLLARYLAILKRPFFPGIFLFTEVWHSLYVTLFGVLGSFLAVSWKGRKGIG